MKHNNIEKLTQKYLDRETSSREEELLHTHIAKCAGCRKYYEGMVQLQSSLHGLFDLQPDPRFNARVLAQLSTKKVFAWTKLMIASITISVMAFIILVFSPWTAGLLPRALLTLPAALRLFDKVRFIVTTLGQTLEPFLGSLVNPFYPAVGIVLSILIMYVIGKALQQKEAPCKA